MDSTKKKNKYSPGCSVQAPLERWHWRRHRRVFGDFLQERMYVANIQPRLLWESMSVGDDDESKKKNSLRIQSVEKRKRKRTALPCLHKTGVSKSGPFGRSWRTPPEPRHPCPPHPSPGAWLAFSVECRSPTGPGSVSPPRPPGICPYGNSVRDMWHSEGRGRVARCFSCLRGESVLIEL